MRATAGVHGAPVPPCTENVARLALLADRELHTLLGDGAFFESPRWHDGRWWVSDFYRHLVLTVDADGDAREVLQVEAQPSGIGWMPDGSMLVVSMRDHRVLRWTEQDGATEHADLSEYCGGHLNDMVVDSRGRAYVGNFGFDLMGGGDPAPATLVRVDPDGTASVAAEEMLFPNGSVITPDGRTLIVGETAGARYTAFTIEDRMAAGSMPTATSGRPTRSTGAALVWRRAARSLMRSPRPRGSTSSPACSAVRMGARC
jgi:sugar lactone lactonase YvrE